MTEDIVETDLKSLLDYYVEGVEVDPDMQPLVIDPGSGLTKLGFSGDDAPRAVIPTIVGRPKHPGIMVGMDAKDCFVGEEARAKRGILKLKYPIEHGFVTNWNDFEKIMHHSFYNELRVTPEEHPVLLCEGGLGMIKNNREKATSILFETFNVPAFYLAKSVVLGLLATGRTSGCSVSLGEGHVQIMPVYDSQAVAHAGSIMNIGTRDITHYLVKILAEKGYEMTTSAEREIVRDIMEKHSFVSMCVAEEIEVFEKFHFEKKPKRYCYDVLNYFEYYEPLFHIFPIELCNEIYSFHHFPIAMEYELPDGSKMTLDTERFRAPEILFTPSFIEMKGIHEQIWDCVQKCDPDMHTQLSENVILSGGASNLPSIEYRLDMELRDWEALNRPSNAKKLDFDVRKMEKGEHSAWIGGSVLSSLSSFSRSWITKDQYDDVGAHIVHRKCL